jgi:hypothetical protein
MSDAMARLSDAPPVITAKWKIHFESDAEHFGTIILNNELQIRFPILNSFDDIPCGTTVLWGVADDLHKCTAVTLPFPPSGHTSNQNREMISHTYGFIRYLLIGHTYIQNPDAPFVSSLTFTPQPNKDLHKRQYEQFIIPRDDILDIKFSPSCEPDRMQFTSALFAKFAPEQANSFAANIEDAALTVRAWIDSENCVRFCLQFDAPRKIESALAEAYTFCAFLSFTAHQYVYPGSFFVSPTSEDEGYKLYCPAFSTPSAPQNTWVRNTLVLPEDQQFGDVLKRWYASNEEVLPSRYLYRYSLLEPNTYSPDRFLAIFRAIEGIMRKSAQPFLTRKEMDTATSVLTEALTHNPHLDDLLAKLRSSNYESPSRTLKASYQSFSMQ